MAGRARRWVLRGLVAGVALLLFGVGFVLWLARSDWGREQVRSRLEAGLGDALNGTVRVGSVEGNLLNEITLTDVVVDDALGEPVLQVERMVLDASIRALIGRRVELSNVELIRPTLYLTQADDGSWNVSRLVAADTVKVPVGRDSVALGFGSWVRVHAAVIDDGRVVVRQPWPLPSGPLADSGQVRLDTIGGRVVVVRDVRAIDARLADLVLADPEEELSGRLASLSAAAHLLEGPPLEVHDLAGSFALEAEEGRAHVAATTVELRFDGARAQGHGELSLGDSATAGPAEFRFEALDTRLVQRFMPDMDVPLGVAEGLVTLDAAVDERGGPLRAEVTFRRSADSALSRVHADGRLALGTDAAVRDMMLRLDPLNLSWMEEVDAAWADAGSLAGTVRVDGPLRGVLAIDADVTHHAGGVGRVGDSRLLAEGGVEASEGVSFRDMVVRMEPLQVGAVEMFAGALPVGGTLTGRVALNGEAAGALSADLDVAHQDTTGLTRLVGNVQSTGSGNGRTLRADLNAPVLALATAGRFAPAAGLRGTAAAELEADGPLDRLAVALTLEESQGGTLALTGTLDATEPGRRYDLDARFVGTDVAALSSRAPETALWGTASLRGSGFDPRTMDAVVQVAAVDSVRRIPGPVPDSAGGAMPTASPAAGGRIAPQGGVVRIDAHLARGVASVTDAQVRMASATLTAEGALGLVSGTSGELRYTLQVDSLSDFAAWMQPDTTTMGVAARPAVQARRASVAPPTDSLLADSLLADSLPPVDTLPALPRDSLSGRVRLAGTATGNPEALSVRAEGEIADIVALGHLVTRGQVMVDARDLAFTGGGDGFRADSVVTGSRTEPAWLRGLGLRLEADLDTVQLAGFGFESLDAQVEHEGGYQVGEGTVRVAAVQDTSRDYRLHARYDLALERSTLELDSLTLRFDTVRWASRGPGRISWGEGIEVRDLELVGEAGRIRVDGRVPAGEADEAIVAATAAPDALVVEVERLPVGHLADLVQDTLDVRGLLTMHAQVAGTRAAPRVEATMALDSGAVGQVHLPGIEATLDWAEGSLAVDGVLTATNPQPGGAPVTLANVTGTAALALPWDSLAGPRTLDGTLRVDSLPLASVPTLSPAVTNLRGVVRGQVAVGGTLDAPDLDGTLAIVGGGADLNPPGVRLADVTGELRMDGSTLVVDSLNAVSGGGPLFATGSIELEGDDGPVADLTLRARRALIANFDQAEGVRADADLRVVGPVTALAVTGTARIREGIFYAQIDQTPALDLEGGEVEHAVAASEAIEAVLPPSNPLSGLRADVAVRVDRNTWIRAMDGTAEIYTPEDGAPLSIRYDASQDLPALDGVVHADRGEWAFAGRRFELTTGTATFLRASEMDPLLQLTAVHEVVQPGRDPLEILITVGGRLKAPVVTLSSDAQPPLPQTDLLSYLVFGTSSGSLMQQGGSGLAGSGAAQVGALAAQQLSSVVVGTLFEEALADIEARSGRYGLDVLRITAAELPEELAFDTYFQNVLRGTQIEAGKYVTPRLFVAARGRTTTEALPGLRSEYRTQSGFRWTAAWEPRYLPLLPAFGSGGTAEQTRALSTFLFWKWRF